ncbi:MAG TPA: MBL fold metallo-hydrolase [Thermodesulfobacteriota bacterium]|nr:MBL fold metallo-hydrolase [Thermodesulfobacteriota bacterium]
MKLYILGSGTCVPYERRGSSGYALRLPKSTLLLDCGNGTTWKLEKAGINYLDIDHIFLSHFHPDHTADLIPFLFATKYTQSSQRVKQLHIWGAEGFLNFFSALKEAYNGWITPDCLNVSEIKEGAIEFRDFRVIVRKTVHIESSLAYRIESEGKSLVYSGDTDYSESLIELAKGADALILECSAPDQKSKVKGHLTPDEVTKIANEARVKRLIITHLYPVCDENKVIEKIRRKTAVETILAEDLMEIKI